LLPQRREQRLALLLVGRRAEQVPHALVLRLRFRERARQLRHLPALVLEPGDLALERRDPRRLRGDVPPGCNHDDEQHQQPAGRADQQPQVAIRDVERARLQVAVRHDDERQPPLIRHAVPPAKNRSCSRTKEWGSLARHGRAALRRACAGNARVWRPKEWVSPVRAGRAALRHACAGWARRRPKAWVSLVRDRRAALRRACAGWARRRPKEWVSLVRDRRAALRRACAGWARRRPKEWVSLVRDRRAALRRACAGWARRRSRHRLRSGAANQQLVDALEILRPVERDLDVTLVAARAVDAHRGPQRALELLLEAALR